MASYLYNVDMAKEKLTIYLSADIARSMRVSAARRGIKDSDLVEEALRDKLLTGILERSWARNDDLSEDEAMRNSRSRLNEKSARSDAGRSDARRRARRCSARLSMSTSSCPHSCDEEVSPRTCSWRGKMASTTSSSPPHCSTSSSTFCAATQIARRIAPAAAPELLALIGTDALLIDDPPPRRHVERDPDDDYLITLALAAGAHAIVTGDTALLGLELDRPRILTPRDFLTALEPLA